MLQALSDRIIVVEDPEEERSIGGVVLPATMTDREPNQGTVVSVGSRVRELEKDQRVMYTAYNGVELGVKGPEAETYVVLTEDDVVGIILEE